MKEYKIIEAFSSLKVPLDTWNQNWHTCYEFMPKLPKLFSNFIFSSKSSTAVIYCFLTDRQKIFTELWAVFRSNLGKNQVLRFWLMPSFPRNPVVTSTSVFKTMQNFYAKSQKIPWTTSETKNNYFSQNLPCLRKTLL